MIGGRLLASGGPRKDRLPATGFREPKKECNLDCAVQDHHQYETHSKAQGWEIAVRFRL